MRKLQGVIVSNKMNRTAVVRVDRLTRHPRYHKYYRVSQKFKADTAGGEYHTGDIVAIQETRPMSKEKRWKIVEVVKASSVEADKVELDSQ